MITPYKTVFGRYRSLDAISFAPFSRYSTCFSGIFIRLLPVSKVVFSAFLLLLLLSLPSSLAYAQSSEEEEIKKVIRAETDAWRMRDADAWMETWHQSPEATRTIVINNNLIDEVGWENFSPTVMEEIQEDPIADVREYVSDSFNIRTSGDLAWVNYHQVVKSADDGTESHTREQRVLVKEDDQWKILSQTTYVIESFDSGPLATRNNLTAIAYGLYEEDKLEQAIEVLELNAKLYPGVWNVYNDLGFMHAELGNKHLAIKNYERSLQLNPRNEDGSKALAELRE